MKYSDADIQATIDIYADDVSHKTVWETTNKAFAIKLQTDIN